LLAELGTGEGFLDRLTGKEVAELRRVASPVPLEAGQVLFEQGQPLNGIYFVEAGSVRTWLAGSDGEEITLATWTPGHFIDGPEVYRGVHLWSAAAVEATRLLHIAGPRLRRLAQTMPGIAMCLIDGLAAKGRCYAALARMLATRSQRERLAQVLLILAELDHDQGWEKPTVKGTIAPDRIAIMVGTSRQWVMGTLAEFQRDRLIVLEHDGISIEDPVRLRSVD